MSIPSFLKSQAERSGQIQGSPFGLVDMDQQFMRLESAFNALTTAKGVYAATKVSGLTSEEIRFSHHTLNSIPSELQPAKIRMEGYAVTVDGLTYRAEGIIDSIVDKISAFFKWIGDMFAKVFGGGEGSGGGAGVTAAVSATETALSTSGGSSDEFLFKENHAVFKLMDLNNLSKCREYADAVSDSTKAIVEINKLSIKLSEKANKDYQGNFAKDVVGEMRDFSVGKNTAYAKACVGTALPDKTYFAYPVSFLKVRVIHFTESTISLPDINNSGNSNSDKVGEGYIPKDVYIKASEWKALVDHFAKNGKVFYDSVSDLKSAGAEFQKLASLTKEWKHMEPESAKKVGDGIRQLNNVASFTYKSVKQQQDAMDKLFKVLKDVAENDLRDNAKGARKAEAEAAAAEANKGKPTEATGPMVP